MQRSQLRDAGLRRSGVRHATTGGRLFPRPGDLFLVGHESPSVDAELHRALLLGGAGSVISHRLAGWVWKLLRQPPRLEVTAPSNRRSRGLVLLHQATLDPRDDVTHRRGMPVTSLLRTLVDLAAVLPEEELAGAINEAAIKGWLHRRNVAALLARSRGRRGAVTLRGVLAARDRSEGWTRSTLEADFARLARDGALPRFKRGTLVDIGDGDLRECDVVWREPRVMVELDFLPIHETGRVPYRDRRRDRRLAAAGWTVIRVTGDDLENHRAELLADLRKALEVAG